MSFADDLGQRLHRDPDQPTWEYRDRIFTRGEAAALANRVTGLLREAGVPADASIGLVMRNRPLQAAALVGLVSANWPVTTIYAFQAPSLLARDLTATRFAAVIADAEDWSDEVVAAARVAGSVGIRLALDEREPITRLADTPLRAAHAYHRIEGEPALEVLSSGTTGPPKRISFPFRLLVRAVEGQMASRMGDSFPTDICTWPFGGIGGLSNLIADMMLERLMVLIDRFNVPEWVAAVKRHRPEFVTGPPAVAQMMVDANVAPEDVASIRYFYGGSAPLPDALRETLRERYGIAAIWAYGATEFCGTVISWSLPLHERYGESKKGAMGKPLPGIDIRVVDTVTGAPLGTDAQGYLEARVPSIGPDWIRTTDLALIDADGFVFHHGRGDGAIMRGGFKVLPEMIVDALRRHPDVFDASVVGMPDPRLGQVPVAAVQLRKDAARIGPDDLARFLRGEVASTYIPTRILIVPELPRTPSMKIDQRAVKALFS